MSLTHLILTSAVRTVMQLLFSGGIG